MRRLRFAHRIGLLVVLATIALLAVTAVTLVLGQRSQRELLGIETHYLPIIELDRDLTTTFIELARALEDAASAADEGRLADADDLGRLFLRRLADDRETIARNGGDASALERDYRAYFKSARAVSAAIVAGTGIDQLEEESAAMQRARQALRAQLQTATTPDRKRLAAAFETARKSQRDAARIELAVALATIVAMILLSWWIARRTVTALRDVGAGVERLARGELGEIEVTTNDEIGDLAREANRTAAKLREYRERTESLLAETQRQAEELARARQAQQERADAAENATRELEAFSYSVAHDLRSPLRAINGFAAALAEDLGSAITPEAGEHVARIRGAAVRMGELIDALLGLSRVSRAELARKRIDVTKLANDVLAQLRSAEPSRTVRTVVQERVTADGDPQLVRALFENLLGNAWKFVGERTDARIEVGRGDDGTYFVRDNGAGFDMAYANKLFVPFQRLHSAAEYPGTGIGLATVQRVVRRHGGTIWAEGAVDQGATFFFTLPSARSHL